jgi:hypothetical protein
MQLARRSVLVLASLALLPAPALRAQPAPATVEVRQADDHLQIDTEALQARIRKKGYVSGIAQNSFLDRKTGARDVGFGLHIMDFRMAPGWRYDGYQRNPKYHGNLAKHYIEGTANLHEGPGVEPRGDPGEGLRRGQAALPLHRGCQGAEGRLALGTDARLSAEGPLRPVQRTHHQRQ